MRLLLVLACVALAAAAPTSLIFSNVFGDHMVLQRNRVNPVWGWTVPGHSVQLSVSGGPSLPAVTADSSGFWINYIPSRPASFDAVTISAADAALGQTVSIVDVLFGDVFFCSGQSNMEFTVSSAFNSSEEVQAANGYPGIRITSGPEQGFFNLNDVKPGPYSQLAIENLPWSVANNITVGCLVHGCSGWNYFSAACWFTLKPTFDLLGGTVPLGGIAQTYGGTSIQWWSSAEALQKCNAPPGSACCGYGGTDSCLFDTQVAPYTLGPTQLAGFLWYQGEQNAGCGGAPQIDYYGCALPALISDIRTKFNQPTLPFGVFLLAAWQSNSPWFPLLRLTQVAASVSLPYVFTASTLDYGEPAGGPVHSPFKQVPGHRAALALQAILYKMPVAYLGPRYSGVSVAGPTATVSFDPATLYGASLVLNTSVSCPTTVTADSCEAFAVQIDTCVWLANVTASLTGGGTTLSLTLPADFSSHSIVATRGYFGNWPLVQLYNAAGLPAEPWLANVTGAAHACPPPGALEAALPWVDTGVHA